ncbi:hypothetical protein B1400_1524 [Bifidobacterium italicum]|uniref:Uncharacterized protein n=1 Tax=Bifidobacterium italicum TaxID=1960968 RepID=A0A2A2EFR2_9BIFI|nr:hypothetical protein [Bifidobacterium italicum]PAU67841.1 hypothetical protein B1400_1524 [Bifidobacterium italicum]
MSTKEEIEMRIYDYLERQGFDPHRDDRRDAYVVLMETPSRIGALVITIRVCEQAIVATSTCMVKADAGDIESMHEVSEYLQRATYGMKVGGFELDFDDGQAQFRASMPIGDDLPEEDEVGLLTLIGPSMWAKYGDGFLKVALMGASAEEVIEAIENADAIPELDRLLRRDDGDDRD